MGITSFSDSDEDQGGQSLAFQRSKGAKADEGVRETSHTSSADSVGSSSSREAEHETIVMTDSLSTRASMIYPLADYLVPEAVLTNMEREAGGEQVEEQLEQPEVEQEETESDDAEEEVEREVVERKGVEMEEVKNKEGEGNEAEDDEVQDAGLILPRLLYKGHTYDAATKCNLQMLMIEHAGADVIEVIAFNLSTFVEAPHVFVPASLVVSKALDAIQFIEKIELILLEYDRLGLPAPDPDTVLRELKYHRVAGFLLARMVVVCKPAFTIDIREDAKPKTVGGSGRRMSRSALPGPDTTQSLATSQPFRVAFTTLKRYGKFTTQAGEPVEFPSTKESDVLFKVVSHHFPSATAPPRRGTVSAAQTLRGKLRDPEADSLRLFAKFKNNNPLMVQSLSFLHVSDMVLCQAVCKRWRMVLVHAIKTTASMHLTSRAFHYLGNLQRERTFTTVAGKGAGGAGALVGGVLGLGVFNRRDSVLPVATGSVGRPLKHRHNAMRTLGPPPEFRLMSHFVLPDTVLRLLKASLRCIVELRLHYVVLDVESICLLSGLNGRLRKLSLGTVKVDDEDRSTRGVEETAEAERPSKVEARRPSRPTIAPPPGRSIPGGRRASTAVVIAEVPREPTRPTKPVIVVAQLRFLASDDVQALLFSCGSSLEALELSAIVGVLSPEVFKFAPRLTSLTVHDTILAPCMSSALDGLEGDTPLWPFVQALAGIEMAALLTLMADARNEAFMLTDKRGKVVVANHAWTRLFGYRVEEVEGYGVGFVTGPLTDKDEFSCVVNGLKSQVHPEECVTFLHGKDNRPFLCQVILLPNVSRMRGLPLDSGCLSEDFLGELALRQEEERRNRLAGTRGAHAGGRESTYHLLRFGSLGEQFVPYAPRVRGAGRSRVI